jgi:hypothetical protein
LDVAAIHQAIFDNQSLLLNKVHRLHGPTGFLCRQLTADFRSAGVVLRKPIRANAYFTPPHSQGFAPHFDDHDVLVLQLHGEKLWRLHGEVAKWPRKPMLDALPSSALKHHPDEVLLQAGDVFYLPRGFVHEAIARDHASLHLTLSVQAATWSDVFERLIELQDQLGEPLPLNFCNNGVPQTSDKARIAEISHALGQWPGINRAIVDTYNSTFIEGDPPANGLLARSVSEFEVSLETRFTVAEGVSANLELNGDGAHLRLAGAVLRADKRAAVLFKTISSGQSFRLCDLGSSSEASALIDLVQELVRRGVLLADKPVAG